VVKMPAAKELPLLTRDYRTNEHKSKDKIPELCTALVSLDPCNSLLLSPNFFAMFQAAKHVIQRLVKPVACSLMECSCLSRAASPCTDRCCLQKSGQPLPKDIAAWMLLHHASSTSATDGIVTGAAGTCLSIMFDSSANIKDAARPLRSSRSSARTRRRKVMLRLRAGGKSVACALLALVLNRSAAAVLREKAARCLDLLTATLAAAQVRFAPLLACIDTTW
jgi:hypothetical protein